MQRPPKILSSESSLGVRARHLLTVGFCACLGARKAFHDGSRMCKAVIVLRAFNTLAWYEPRATKELDVNAIVSIVHSDSKHKTIDIPHSLTKITAA